MTLIGEAELDIRAVGAHFTTDVNSVVKPGMAQAGAEMEKTAARGGRAASLMFRTIAQSAGGAFAPVTQALGQITGVMDELKGARGGLRIAGIGAAGLGVGAGLQAWASQEQAAKQQLQATIEDSGHSWDEYGDRIAKAVRQGERHGVTANTTLDALNRITVSSKSVDKALDAYNFTLGAAALKHISVAHAAGQVALAYGGNTRALKSVGINLADGTRLTAAATEADKRHAAAVTALHKAETRLHQVRERLGATTSKHTDLATKLASAQARVASAEASVQTVEWKHGQQSPQLAAARARLTIAELALTKARQDGSSATGLSVSQQITLTNAQAAVKAAEDKVTTSTQAQAVAHKAAAGAITTVDQAIATHSNLIHQADAQTNTWTGHLKAFGATVEDDAARFGSRYGPAITAASTAVMALGTATTITQAIASKLRGTTLQSTVAITAEGRAAAVTAGELDALATAEGAAAAGGGAAGAAGVSAAAAGKGGLLGGVGGALAGLGGATIASAYIGTAGGDQAPGQEQRVSGSKQAQTLADIIRQIAIKSPVDPSKWSAAQQNAYSRSFIGYGSGAKIDQTMALAFVRSYGSAAQIAAVRGMTDPATAGGHVDPQLLSLLNSAHMTLLAIQHNTATGAHNTHDLHSTIQRDGRVRFGRSPELATLG